MMSDNPANRLMPNSDECLFGIQLMGYIQAIMAVLLHHQHSLKYSINQLERIYQSWLGTC